MKNKSMAQHVSCRLEAPPLPDRCVIVVPGQNIEVTAVFNSWIYEGPESEIHIEPRGKRPDYTASNQGIIEALRD